MAKELFEKLKNELLIIEDWRKKQSTRVKVVNVIEEICDKLPKIYDAGIFQAKCKNLYEHIYDRYPDATYRVGSSLEIF